MAGKVALVTGGGRGIGRGIALALGRAGSDVAIGYGHDRRAAMSAVQDIRVTGSRAIALRGDLRQPMVPTKLVEATAAEFGRLDILISNAGALYNASFIDMTSEQYDVQFDVNARAAFLLAQAAARQMIAQGGGGRIVFVTSQAAVKAYAGISAYCMSKAATRMLTQVAAIELAPHNITVNAVAPGTTRTDMNSEMLANSKMRKMLLSRILLGRTAVPDDVSAAVVYLLSDGASFVTGTTLAVDGGSSIS